MMYLTDEQILQQWRVTYNGEPPREVMHLLLRRSGDLRGLSAAVTDYTGWTIVVGTPAKKIGERPVL